MTVRKPKSMDELLYFTNRDIGKGEATVWVFKEQCGKCGKALMGKPTDEKTGRVKVRAKEYVCPKCGYTEEKAAYEQKLLAHATYTCPACSKEGETTAPFKRKKVKGTETLRLTCAECEAAIDVTKKMKEAKKA